jgi:hypothetical protein
MKPVTPSSITTSAAPARAATTAVADFERRIGRIETPVSVNTAVLAMNTALVIAVAGRLFHFF